MYEFKSKVVGKPQGLKPFPFREYEKISVAKFVKCPKFLTLVRHADLEETTPLHCFCSDTQQPVGFYVPQQELLLKISSEGLRFSVLRVISQEQCQAWLIVCEWNRQGFLVPLSLLDTEDI